MSTTIEPPGSGFTGLYTQLDDGSFVQNIDENGNYVGPISGSLPFVTVGFDEGCTYVCDGVADQVQINAAITAINAAGGGEVRLKGGTQFNTTAIILMKSNVSLIGDGMGKTIIKGSTSDYVLIGTTKTGTTKTVYSNISVEGITFLSRKGHCSQFNNVSVLSVERSEFYFTGSSTIRESLWCQHCQYVWTSWNYLHGLTGDGVQINSTDYFGVYGNHINGGSLADDGIDIDFDFLDTSAIPSRYGSVVGNIVENINVGNGIRVENSSFVSVGANTVSDCLITTGNAAGIKVNLYASTDSMQNISVVGNTITNCVSNGICIGGDAGVGTAIPGVVVTGNTLNNCGQSGGSNIRSGIQLYTPGVHCADNILNNCGTTGGNSAGIIVYKVNNSTVVNNEVNSSTTGIRLWNGDGLQSYTGTTITENKGTGNSSNMVLSGFTSGEIFNNFTDNNVTANANGAVTVSATGTNQNVTLTPSGTGASVLNGNVGVGTTGPVRDVQIQKNNPIIRIVDTAQTAPAGNYEIQSQGDVLKFFRGLIGTSANEKMAISNSTTQALIFEGMGVQDTSGGLFTGTTLTSFPTSGSNYVNNGSPMGLGTTSPKTTAANTNFDLRGSHTSCAGFSNSSARPAVGTTRIDGEVAAIGNAATSGVGNADLTADDGFMRISAGGGTTANTKTYIDLSGFSNTSDMDKNIVFGTAGTERMRIDKNGSNILNSVRHVRAKGANVVAANDLTLGLDGNTFVITGNTQINAITVANWNAGSEIRLIFTGTPTVKHNTAGGAGTAPLLLSAGVDLVASNPVVLTLTYDGANWQEASRSVNHA